MPATGELRFGVHPGSGDPGRAGDFPRGLAVNHAIAFGARAGMPNRFELGLGDGQF